MRRPLVAAFLASALVGGCGAGPSPSAAPGTSVSAVLATASPTPAPIPTASPTAPPSLAPGINVSWASPSADFEPHIPTSGLARIGNGAYLVLGQALSIGGKTGMGASSMDGSSWTIEAGLTPVADVTLRGAAAIDALGPNAGPTVAVGSRLSLGPDQSTGLNGTVTGVVYLKRSSGGWIKVPDQASLARANLVGVIATNACGGGCEGGDVRFVAYGGYASGSADSGCIDAGCTSGAGVWTSNDGEIWTAALRVPAPNGSDMTLAGVVSGPTGLIAYARSGIGPESTLIWTSPDGHTWTAAHPTGLDGVGIHGMVGRGGSAFFGSGGSAGYLGVGTRSTPGSTVFGSADGIHWIAMAAGPSLEGLIEIDDGFIAWSNIAFTTDVFVRDSYGVWASQDGTTWTATAKYDEFFSGGMVANGRSILSIGSNNDPNPVWLGTITVVPGP